MVDCRLCAVNNCAEEETKTKIQFNMRIKEHHLIMGLLAIAVFSQAFLFSVSYTQASWTNVQRQLPDPFAANLVVPVLSTDLSQVSQAASALPWSVTIASQSFVQQVQPAVHSFLNGPQTPLSSGQIVPSDGQSLPGS
jgi:hypothetical protein